VITETIMKKLFNLVLVSKDGLSKKWWHRLAQVLIYGTTIVVFFVSVFAVFITLRDPSNWETYILTKYNFENGFDKAQGETVDCNIHVSQNTNSWLEFDEKMNDLNCGKLNVNVAEFVDRYNSATKNAFGVSLEPCPFNKDAFGRLTPETLKCMDLTGLRLTIINPQDLSGDNLKKYQDYFVDIKAKLLLKINYGLFIEFPLLALAYVFGWFVFWESIIYRTIVYIIFGKKV
jgi:hypothetical protein